MSAEEIQSATEDRLAQLDVVGKTEEEEAQAEISTEIPPEDFGLSNR